MSARTRSIILRTSLIMAGVSLVVAMYLARRPGPDSLDPPTRATVARVAEFIEGEEEDWGFDPLPNLQQSITVSLPIAIYRTSGEFLLGMGGALRSDLSDSERYYLLAYQDGEPRNVFFAAATGIEDDPYRLISLGGAVDGDEFVTMLQRSEALVVCSVNEAYFAVDPHDLVRPLEKRSQRVIGAGPVPFPTFASALQTAIATEYPTITPTP